MEGAISIENQQGSVDLYFPSRSLRHDFQLSDASGEHCLGGVQDLVRGDFMVSGESSHTVPGSLPSEHNRSVRDGCTVGHCLEKNAQVDGTGTKRSWRGK